MRFRSSWYGVTAMMLMAMAVSAGRSAAQTPQAGIRVNSSIKLDQGSIYSETIGALNRLMIKANPDAWTVISNNYGSSDPTGVAASGMTIDKNGAVAFGNISCFAGRTLLDRVYFGEKESMVFHDGGTKGLIFNCEYDAQDQLLKYISNNGGPAAAGGLFLDYARKLMTLWMVDQGSAGSFVSDDERQGITIDKNGQVSVHYGPYYLPDAALDVCGALRLTNSEDYSVGMIRVMYGSLWASDCNGNYTVFSPHTDPRQIAPQAQTSFADQSVALPFSFHHKNEYLGKGQVIDMSKAIKYLDQKMRAEMGEQAGKIVFEYDLPKTECKTRDDYDVQVVMDELRMMKPVKVAVDKDGRIPPEALIEVNEIVNSTRVDEVEEKKVDFEAGRIMKVKRKMTRNVAVPTGRKVRQFRPGWSFENGELYRQPTVNDIDVTAILRKHPKLPQWIVDRIGSGRKSAQSVSGLVDEIKKRLAEMEGHKSAEVAQLAH